VKFWDKVQQCKHETLGTNTYIGTCSTPYCGSIHEDHCLDCGVFISQCACGSNNRMGGWSTKREQIMCRKKKAQKGNPK